MHIWRLLRVIAKRLWLEGQLSLPLWIWIFPLGIWAFRLLGLFEPLSAVGFAELAAPLAYALLLYDLLGREVNWGTLELLIACPRRKFIITLSRSLWVGLWLFVVVAGLVEFSSYLAVLAPALMLGNSALLLSTVLVEAWGIGVALAWWGWSLIVVTERLTEYLEGSANWILLGLTRAGLSQEEFLMRKWVQLGAGLILWLLSLIIVERKRYWRLRE